MLQWMGGSRRKVNDSRSSKQKRQKQYFEQRKRQQHEHITSSPDNFVDGYNNTCSKNQKEKRSLDVLSLHSLSQVAEGCSSACDGILKVDAFPEKCLKTRNLPKIINKIVAPANNIESLQTRNTSNTPEKRMPVEDFRIGTSKLYNSTSAEGNPEGKELKHASGHKFEDSSVFELIDEDGKSSNTSEEKAEYEAHVAFSMQGLGKVGNETPVKSPQSSRRILSDGQSGFFKAARQQYLHRNFDNLLADHEIDMESMIENGDMFSNGKYLSSDYGQGWRFGSHDHPKHDFLKGNSIELYDENPQVKSFDDKENIDDTQEFHTNFLEVPTGFPIGSSYNEKFDMSRENGCFTDVFSIIKTQEADFTEDLSFAKRISYSDQYGRTDRFCDLDFSSRYPKHQEVEDYDFLKSNESNCFIANKFPNAGGKQSRFSFLKADNPMDNFSSLSGESCSSSAVRGDGIMGATTARKSRKRSSAFVGVPSDNRSITEDFFGQPAMSTKCIPGQRGECDRPRAYSRSSDSYPSRPVDFSDFAFGESFGQFDDPTGKDGFYHSTSIHLARHTEFGSSCHSFDKDHSRNCKPVGEDILGLLSASGFHFDSHLSFGGCKDDSSVESASPMGLPSKKFAFDQDLTSFPDNGCGKNRKGSHQGIATFVQSSDSTEVSGKRETEDLLTEQCSAHRNAHDNSIKEKGSHEEEICAGPEGSVTPKAFRETHDKLSNKNTNDMIFQENDNDTSSFVGLSDNSGSKASEKECRNNYRDLQSQQLDPEISESEHNSVASDGEDSSIEPSYQLMMLESHMLRLLCVKKKRKSAQKEEILKTVKVSI